MVELPLKPVARIVILFVVVTPVYWLMTQGGGVMSRAVEATRKVVAMWNLRSLKNMVLTTGILQAPAPVLAWSDEDFSDFVRDNLTVQSDGDADPALDPWDLPYLLDAVDDGRAWILSSTGPNRGLDLCDFEGPGGDDICLRIEADEISR